MPESTKAITVNGFALNTASEHATCSASGSARQDSSIRTRVPSDQWPVSFCAYHWFRAGVGGI
jgi:hypothetical protein